MTYAEKLKSPKWQKKRLEILNRDNWECKLCNDKETTLNIHHLKYTKEPWDAPKSDLITLCEHCHTLISKSDINIDGVLKIEKFKKVYYTNDIVGFVVLFNDSTSFYELNNSNVNMVIKFSKGSKVLKSIYNLNNGK
jgi:hypothetical protein